MKNKERKTIGELAIKRISIIIIFSMLLQILFPVIGSINIMPNVYGTDLLNDINGNVVYTEINGEIYAEIRNINVDKVIIVNQCNDRKVTKFSIIQAQQGKNQFKNLKNLKRLTIPVQLLTDETLNSFFVGADSIEEITFTGAGSDYKDTTIKTYKGIADLPNLKKITIGEGIRTIENSAFANCKALQEVEINSNQLNEIATSTFAYCNELKNVTIKSKNLKRIGMQAFYGCGKLEKVRIETESIDTILSRAFKNCSNLLDFIFIKGNNVKTIGDEAFYGCSRLGSFSENGIDDIVGKQIESIGTSAFKNCGWFGSRGGGLSIDLPNLSHIGESAFERTAIRSATLKNSKVKEILPFTFAYCRYLYIVTLPENLTSIGNGAFLNSNGGDNVSSSGRAAGITSNIKIPDTVKEIGDMAFANYNDNDITLPNNTPNMGLNVFSGFKGKIICGKGTPSDAYLTQYNINHQVTDVPNYYVYEDKHEEGIKSTYSLYINGNNDVRLVKAYIDTNTFILPGEVNINNKKYKITTVGAQSVVNTYSFIPEVEFSENLKTIEGGIFTNVSSVCWLTVPKSVTSIANDAFANTTIDKIWCYKGTVAETYAKNNGIEIGYLDKDGEQSKKKSEILQQQNNSKVKQQSDNQKQQTTTEQTKNTVSTVQTPKTTTPVVTKDTQKPSINIKLSSTTTPAKNVVLSFNAQDSGKLSGYKLTESQDPSYGQYYTIYGSRTSYSGSYTIYDNKTYYLYVKDVSGNVACKKVNITNIDLTSPEITSVNLNPNTESVKEVKLTWQAKDNGVGIKYWKINQSTEVTDNGYTDLGQCYSSYGATYTFTNNGTYYLWIKDDNGNWIWQSLNINNIDKTAPEIKDTMLVKQQGYTLISCIATDFGTGLAGYKISTDLNAHDGYYNSIEDGCNTKQIRYKVDKPGKYYIFVKDQNENKVRKEFNVDIDNSKPVVTSSNVTKYESYANIQFLFTDDKSGVKYWKISTKADGSDGTYVRCKYQGKEANLLKGTINQTIKKDGTYYIVLKDAAGWESISEPIKIDFTKPYITKFEKISNTGKTYENVNYIKENSKLKFRATFSEKVKNVDVSKIKLNGYSNVYSKLELEKVSDKIYDIIITGDKRDNQNISISIEEGFLTDLDGNISKKSEAANKIKIVADNKEPKINCTYINNKITTLMTDVTGIAKYQWKVIGDNDEELWTGKMNSNLNKTTINHSWSLVRYKDRKVTLYVEDILGNSKTYTIEPDVRANVEFVSKSGNTYTYRITTNVKAKKDSNNIIKTNQEYQDKGYRIVDLSPEGDTGKKFNVTILDTSGSNKTEVLNLAKGTIYAYGANDSREIVIPIKIDKVGPIISIGNYEKNKKQREIELTFNLIDSDSGIKQYEFSRNGSLIKRKVVNSSGSYADKITVVRNGDLKLTVWDNQGNKTEKTLTFNNLDRTAPKVSSIMYSKPDNNGDVLVTITANEAVTIEGWANISYTIKQKKYKESVLTGEGVKDVVKLVDEAGNELSVNLKDEIAPRMVGNVIKTAVSSTVTEAKIKFTEEVALTEEQVQSGWSLSKDKKTITKNLSENEDITVTDLAGNEIEDVISIDISNTQNNKLYKGKKNEPSDTNKPTTQAIKYIYLNRPIQRVDMQTLNGHAQCELLDNGKTVKLIFNKKINYNHKIKFIENDDYSEYLTIVSVKNVVKKGDSNNDGSITQEDLTLMKNVATGKQAVTDEYKIFAMDTNDDGKIDIEDISALSDMLANS